jgi:hypothetical protein
MPKLTWKKAWDVLAVLVIFACTGTAAAFLSGKISGWLGLARWSLSWWFLWVVLIFPLYQVLLLGFASVFGKYDEFRLRQVRILRGIKSWVTGRKPKDIPDGKGSG